MIKNIVYKLKKETLLAKDINLPEGQVIEIVMDVIYINGYPVPPAMQSFFYNWITSNPSLFDDITKKW